MAVLTNDEKLTVQAAIDYLQGSQEIPLDAKVFEILAPLADKFGYGCGCSTGLSLQDALRDSPISTLLASLLAVSASE